MPSSVSVPKICPKYANDMPRLCPRYTQTLPKNMANICPRYAKNVPKICLRYTHDLQMISCKYAQNLECPRNAKDVLKLFPSYDKNIYNICLKYYFKCAQDMSKIPIPKICLRYVQYMLYIEARYAGDKLSNYHEFLYIYNQTSYNI